MAGIIWNTWQDMRGGNDSFPMEGGKTVQANKPETESKDPGDTQATISFTPEPRFSLHREASSLTQSFYFLSEPEKELFLNMKRSPLPPNGPTLSLVR